MTFALTALLPLGQLAWDGLRGDGSWDLAPVQALLLTESQQRLFANSLLVAGGASGLAVAIGVPFAFVSERTDLPGRRLLGLAYLVPLLIPPYLHAIVWSRLLAQNGSVNRLVQATLGLGSAPLSMFNITGVVCVLGLAWFPLVALLTKAGLRAVDPSLEEAALLRQGPRRAIAGVTLPLVAPHVLAGAILVFVFAIIDFGVPDILRVRVYAVEIFIQFSALYDQRGAVVLALPLLVATLVLVGVQARLMRGRAYVSLSHGVAGVRRYALGQARFPALLCCWLILALSVLVPVVTLAIAAGAPGTYARVLEPALGSLGMSLLLALTAAGLTALLAFVIAHSLLRARQGPRAGLHYLTQVPFAVPPILLGIALIGLWNRPATGWLYDSVAMVVLGYVAHFLPFAICVVHAGLQQFDQRLEEAAWLAIPGRMRITRLIILPLVRGGLAAGFLIVFVLAMGELGVTLLVVPPGVETLPVRIYNLMHYGAEDAVAALSLILLATQLVLCLLALAVVGWKRGASR
ncbi:ABC transporter permease [Candidatus Thiodictyon syntrophicum]|jgi:iron(III) transport system permease protein|nr:iron ABC transporter permease [Candidatus Thiodictyon syntrophicum]